MNNYWDQMALILRPLMVIIIIGGLIAFTFIALAYSLLSDVKKPIRFLSCIGFFICAALTEYNLAIFTNIKGQPIAYQKTETKDLYNAGKTDTIDIKLYDKDSEESTNYHIDTPNLPIRLSTTKQQALIKSEKDIIYLDKVIVKGNINNAKVDKVEVKTKTTAYHTYLGDWEYETNIATVYSK